MPHADPQKSSDQSSSVEQSPSNNINNGNRINSIKNTNTSSIRGKREKQQPTNENQKMSPAPTGRSTPSLREESPTGGSKITPNKTGKDEDDVGSRGSGDQGSTQSSAEDSSEYRDFKARHKKDAAMNSGLTTAASTDRAGEELLTSPPGSLVKDEQNLSSSGAPERTLWKEGSRKSVRILEPATGSSGRLSSCRSLDIDDTEDFLIDTGAINSQGGSSRRRWGLAREESDGSLTHRSFLHELTEVPTEENWDKHSKRSIFWKIRVICGKLVENPYVQLGIIILIIINAIFMGIATFDFVTDNPNVDQGFTSLDKAFLIVFTIELALQLVYRSFSYFTDPWLVFDFVIVVISWSLESLQIVRAFRIFRAFRLVTRIGPLRELVMAIGAVMPRMYAIAMLLLLIFYIFAVLFTELFHDINTETNYFGSLDVSLFTCMELMTLEWAGVTREVMEEKSWAWAPILAFLSVTGFIVFNLIVAVVCDAVAVVDREVQAERMGEFETDTTKLEKAQERIWDMTEHVERMMHSQRELQEVLAKLNTEMEDLTGKRTGIVHRRQSSSRLSLTQSLRDLRDT